MHQAPGPALHLWHSSKRRDTRSAKEVRFSTDTRERMLRGVDNFSNAVKITLGPKGRDVIIDNPMARGARPRTASPSPRKLAQSLAARMLAARQLGASTTAVSPKGNCDEQF